MVRTRLFAPPARGRWFIPALAAVCVLCLLAAGCARRFPTEKIPKMKWLVLNFRQPPAMSTTPRAIRGWWFGARTIRQNPRAGASLTDVIAAHLADLDCVNLYSQIDLKYYFARKRQLLKDAYPYLGDPELQNLLAGVPSLDYAHELGADKLLTGRILREEIVENRTIHWWWSALEVEVEVVDVPSGKIEWSHRYSVENQLASQKTVEVEFAQCLVEDLKREYFLPMLKP